jgi:Ser/Thr protein kinase RdoA (MazF antagonist)
MRNVRVVAKHLARYPGRHVVLTPQLCEDGNTFHRDEHGSFWRIYPFFAGTYAPDSVDDPDIAFQAAQALGRFSRDLASLDPALLAITIPGFHDSARRWAWFLSILRDDPLDRAARASSAIQTISAHHQLLLQFSSLKLPLRIAHNDAKISNVLFEAHSGRALGLIDWDTIMPGTILADFADLTRSLSPEDVADDGGANGSRFNMTYFRALCEGYLPEVSAILEESEKQCLVESAIWITLEQALRFLTDFLQGDTYYKTKYPDHNLARARNQLALYEAMLCQKAVMKAIVRQFL